MGTNFESLREQEKRRAYFLLTAMQIAACGPPTSPEEVFVLATQVEEFVTKEGEKK